jgi:hypothetical protein
MAFAGDWAGFLNGLAFGGSTAYDLQSITGWQDMQQSPLGGAGQLAPKQTRNGSWFEPSFMPDRVVTMVLQIEALSGDFETAINALTAATQPGTGSEIFLSLQMGGLYTTVQGTVTARTIPTTLDYLAGYTAAQIEVTCSDPRRFGISLFGSARIPLSTGGLTWSATWPLTWPSTVIIGSTTIFNPGNAAGLLTMNILGPIVGPVLTHLESGTTFAFAPTFDPGGDSILVDFNARTVLANGQTPRNRFVSQRGWLPFLPGNNTYSLTAASYSSIARAIITAVPAWI